MEGKESTRKEEEIQMPACRILVAILDKYHSIASEGFKAFPTVILKPWDNVVFSSIGTRLDLTIILVLLPEFFTVLPNVHPPPVVLPVIPIQISDQAPALMS